MRQITLAFAFILALAPAFAMSYFSSPAATTAAQNAASLSTSLVCILSGGAAIAVDVENAINAGKATLVVRTGTTTTLQNASATLCAALHGIQEKAVVPAK